MPSAKVKIFVVICAILLFLEVSSRIILPDSKLATLESVRLILNEDPALFWRQKPNLKTNFAGTEVTTDHFGSRNPRVLGKKSPGSYRIICLGDSITFGWGVSYEDTYPALLSLKMNGTRIFNGKECEVINAGQIGYSSYQGLVLLERCILEYSPDMLIVSYGLNDIDRYRFFFSNGKSDKNTSANVRLVSSAEGFFSRSRAYLLLKKCILYFLNKNDKMASDLLRKHLSLAAMRVPPSDYKANLEKMAQICREKDIRLVFLRLPVNLSMPALSEEEQGLLKSGVELSSYYSEIATEYYLNRDYRNAHINFQKAKEYQVIDCYRDSFDYQAIMSDIAQRFGIFSVDAASALSGKDNEVYFNGRKDPIHPSPKGHGIIASQIYSAFNARLETLNAKT